jgi:hypothetical protein
MTTRPGWTASLRGDPLPWLLDEDAPAVRHLALRQLLGAAEDDPDVAKARPSRWVTLRACRVLKAGAEARVARPGTVVEG